MNSLGIGKGQWKREKNKKTFLLPKLIKGKKKVPVTLDIMEGKRMVLNDTESLKI